LQLLYAAEGEARRPDDGSLSQLELSTLHDDKPVTIGLKGHEWYRYHTTCQQTVRFAPNHCDVCLGHPLLWNAGVSLVL